MLKNSLSGCGARILGAHIEGPEYRLSGRTVRLNNGSVQLPDGTLAGSALTMDQARCATP